LPTPSGHRRIIFIPGKNPKPPPALHRQQLWRCLIEGVRRAAPELLAELGRYPDCFSLVAWNHCYYQRDKALGPDLPWIDRLIRKVEATERDRREARSPRRRFARVLYHIGDRFPWFIDLIPDPAVKATIKETERYFNNTDGIAEQVRELVKTPLRAAFAGGENILLIGHSMGSVIAFDALWELWHREHVTNPVDTFLTIGSPLGMHFVQKRLLGADREGAERYPGNIRRWINIAAQGDLVSLDVSLHNDYLQMLKNKLVATIEDRHEGVYNTFRNWKGLNVHRSYGYLVNAAVGATIAKWWAATADHAKTIGA
jgi:hypothetical protein